MQKRVNTILFKNLLETEFLILSSRVDNNAPKFNSGVGVNRLDCKAALALDVFELVKSLKQLVRLLQFLVKQEIKRLSLCIPNRYILSFFELHRKERFLNDLVQLENDSSRIKKHCGGVHLLILVEEFLKSNIAAFQKFLEKDIFLINKINSFLESSHGGTYKVYNEVSGFKKLGFFMALIDAALNQQVKQPLRQLQGIKYD